MAAHHILTSHAFTKKETDQLSVPLQMACQATSETSFVTLSQKRMTLRVEAVLYHVHQCELAVHTHMLLVPTISLILEAYSITVTFCCTAPQAIKDCSTTMAQWSGTHWMTEAHDCEHDVCGLIIKACHDFESRVCSLNAKPDLDKQILWVKDAWKKVCNTVYIDYELTNRILGLVRVQHLRYLGELMLACFRSNHVPRMPTLQLRIQYAPIFHQHMDLLLPITLTARLPIVTSNFMINF